MKAITITSKSLDNNYLLRLLNGNNEMMRVVIHEIFQSLPICLSEINSSLQTNDSLGVITFAARAKSAFLMLREEKLANSFQRIEEYARKGEMSSAKNIFTSHYNETLSTLKLIQEAV
jgi:hypothetical protein